MGETLKTTFSDTHFLFFPTVFPIVAQRQTYDSINRGTASLGRCGQEINVDRFPDPWLQMHSIAADATLESAHRTTPLLLYVPCSLPSSRGEEQKPPS